MRNFTFEEEMYVRSHVLVFEILKVEIVVYHLLLVFLEIRPKLLHPPCYQYN